MAKIPKNRQDSEMLGNLAEPPSFEHLSDGDTALPAAKPMKAEPAKPAYAAFFTPGLQEDIGKALLALQLKLYKQGVVDYTLKVVSEENQIVLKPVPVQKKPKPR